MRVFDKDCVPAAERLKHQPVRKLQYLVLYYGFPVLRLLYEYEILVVAVKELPARQALSAGFFFRLAEQRPAQPHAYLRALLRSAPGKGICMDKLSPLKGRPYLVFDLAVLFLHVTSAEA